MKKAMGFSIMHSITIFVVAVIIFLFIYEQIREEEVSSRDYKICKESVKAQAFLGKSLEDNIVCPTRYHQLEDQKEREQKRELATHMQKCWDQFGAGELELFKNQEDAFFCVVCDNIVFENKQQEPIEGFGEFLLTEKIPQKELTYADYFHNYKGSSDYTLTKLETTGNSQHVNNITIYPDKTYVTVFSYIKGRSSLEKYANLAKAAGEGALITGIGFGVFKAGGALTSTVVGSTVGVPTMIAGGIIMAGGVIYSTVKSWFSEAKPQWASFVELREFDFGELNKIGCEILPAEQGG